MKRIIIIIILLLLSFITIQAKAQKKVYPGAYERAPSYSQYFFWKNNTNEGITEVQTLVSNKPEGYILDQDHNVHLVNQTISFDWQFLAEMLFLKSWRICFKLSLL